MSSSGQTSPTSAPSTNHRRPRQLILTACQNDDVPLIVEALSLASAPDSHETVEGLLSRAVTLSIRRNATSVLTYVLEHGAEVPAYSGLNIEDPPKEVLQILIDHGWDINSRRPGDQPLLWEVVNDGELVTWCLDHGAATIPKDLDLTGEDERRNDANGCPPLLEKAAAQSTVATFELLRSKGAQMGRRALHFAARAAINSGNGGEEQSEMPDKSRAKLHSERMAMLIHLVDKLGVDPNTLDQPKGWMLGNHWGTPLCYVALSNPNWDCTQAVQFLLEKGADPGLVMDPAGWDAVDLATRSKNRRFLDLAAEWKEKQVAQQQ